MRRSTPSIMSATKSLSAVVSTTILLFLEEYLWRNTCGELGKESVRERGSGRERKRGGPPVLQASGGRLARGNRTRTAPCGELAGYRQPWVGFLYLRCTLNQLLIDVLSGPRALLERSVDRQSLKFVSSNINQFFTP